MSIYLYSKYKYMSASIASLELDVKHTMVSCALTDRLPCPFICRLGGRMWKDHSAIPQKRLGGNSLSSGGGDGEWQQHLY